MERMVDAGRGRANVRGGATEGFWALKEANFEVRPGRCLASSGAVRREMDALEGLAAHHEPSEARMIIAGNVGSLLEVGTGFLPGLTACDLSQRDRRCLIEKQRH